MEAQPKQSKSIPFKEFLDGSTNMLTIYAIFNALTAYAISVDQKIAMLLVTPVFMILSILVWWQVVKYAMTSDDGSTIYDIFIFLLALAQLGLVLYFIALFAPMLLLIGLLSLLFVYLFLLQRLTLKWFTNWAAKRLVKTPNEKREQRINKFSFFHLLILMIPATLLTFGTIRLLGPIIRDKIPDRFWKVPFMEEKKDSTTLKSNGS